MPSSTLKCRPGRGRLQDLSCKLLEAQEAERRRIAHELHDEAGQLLASVHLALETTIIGLPPHFGRASTRSAAISTP